MINFRNKLLALCTFLMIFASATFGQNADSTYTYRGAAFQTFTAPVSGWYLLDAKGAQGGVRVTEATQEVLAHACRVM